MQTRPMAFTRFVAVAGLIGTLTAPVASLAAEANGPAEAAMFAVAQGTPEQEGESVDSEGVELPQSSEEADAGSPEAPVLGEGPEPDAPAMPAESEGLPDTAFEGAGEAFEAQEPQASVQEGASEVYAPVDSAPSLAEPVGISVSGTTVRVGAPVTVSAAFGEGDAQGCSYNYVWAKADWSDWGSTVRTQGGYTADASWEFRPSQPGSYILAVDVVRDGQVRTFSTTVEVKPAWTVTGISVNAADPAAGVPFEVSVAFEDGSATEGLSYNYVWMKDDWASWGSTVKDGLAVSDSSHAYTLWSAGTYMLYVDVTGADGASVTLSTEVKVGTAGYGLGVSLGDDGAIVTPVVPEGVEGLRYNYVWQLNGSWADGDWGSTIRDTGSATADAAHLVSLDRNGVYTIYLDILGPDGLIATVGRTVEVDGVLNHADIAAVSSSGSFKVGSTVDVSLPAPGSDPDRYKYNIGWALEDWSQWTSTLAEKGEYASSAQLSFVPTKPGRYLLFVDVVDTKTGAKRTVTRSIDVELGWSVAGLDVAYSGLLTPTSEVVLRAQVRGDSAGLTYNYVWQGNDWANWTSTVRQTGNASTDSVESFTLSGDRGYYCFYVDVTDAYGNTVTYGPQTVYASSQVNPANRVYEVASEYFGSYSPEPFESAVLATGAPLCYGQTGYFCGAFVWWSMTQAGYGDKYCNGNVIVEPRLALRYYQSLGLYDPDIRNVRAGDIVFMWYATDPSHRPADHIMYCLWTDDQGYMAMDANNGPCGTKYFRYDYIVNAGFARVLY